MRIRTALLATLATFSVAACSGGGSTRATRNADDTTTTFDDKGFHLLSNGEMVHQYGPDKRLDAATQAELDRQLRLSATVAKKYPTLADAKKAGYKQAGPFTPGLGTHMTGGAGAVATPGPDGKLTDDEIRHPSNLMYSGTRDDSPIAGFMYTALSDHEPFGFVGPNDHWHFHSRLCVKITPSGVHTLGSGPSKSQATCEKAGGTWVSKSIWMVHVWTIPGFKSSRGVFSDLNPAITCSDGTYLTVRRTDEVKYQTNRCRSDPS